MTNFEKELRIEYLKSLRYTCCGKDLEELLEEIDDLESSLDE